VNIEGIAAYLPAGKVLRIFCPICDAWIEEHLAKNASTEERRIRTIAHGEGCEGSITAVLISDD
jgi:hypothetical protein